MVSQADLLEAFLKAYKGKKAAARRDLEKTNKGKRTLKGVRDPRIALFLKPKGPKTYDVKGLDTKIHTMWAKLKQKAALDDIMKKSKRGRPKGKSNKTKKAVPAGLKAYHKFLKAHKGEHLSRAEKSQKWIEEKALGLY